jgi:hypothetical protein
VSGGWFCFRFDSGETPSGNFYILVFLGEGVLSVLMVEIAFDGFEMDDRS